MSTELEFIFDGLVVLGACMFLVGIGVCISTFVSYVYDRPKDE